MTIQVRKNVFETNSSSSHSLTVRESDISATPFSQEVLRAGVVHIRVGEYGWEWYRYYSPENKMSYFLTQITRGDLPKISTPEELTSALREEYDDVDRMCRVVEEHTGVKVLIHPSSGYVDHQSQGEGMSLFSDEAKLKNFLFSPNSYIQTGNDNDDAPSDIPSDRGSEQYYAAHYLEPKPGYVEVMLVLENQYNSEFRTEEGTLVSPETHPDLFQALQETAVVTKVHWKCTGNWYRFQYSEPRSSTMADVANDLKLHMSQSLVVTTEYNKSDTRNDTAVFTLMVPKELTKDVPA